MDMNLKVMILKQEPESELVIAINDNIVINNSLFDNTLGEMQITLDDYEKMDILEMFKDEIAGIVDGYHYNDEEYMSDYFEEAYKLSVANYEIIKEIYIDRQILIDIVKHSNSKYESLILKKCKLVI